MAARKRANVSVVDADVQNYQLWILAVGQLIVNFGALETLTYIWIEQLSKEEILLQVAADLSLGRRLDILGQLVEHSSLPDQVKGELSSHVAGIRAASEVRNVIAHNPLVFGWKRAERPGPPDLLGVPNLKKLKSGSIVPLGSLHRLQQPVQEVIRIARRLEQLRREVFPDQTSGEA